ncbi:hypothetical protein HN873_044023 [Arachis hypogaea]|nr:purple acid phosphatase 17-like [Arachis hypogaea]XP_025662270.1 purple acid phosphatase 17-like [Arachis hypogaea]QHN86139.1 Purple acid phosphatase [Arachis hypogaea]QHO01603.1 Purple acid phosphatase [Arachis hypogaea]
MSKSFLLFTIIVVISFGLWVLYASAELQRFTQTCKSDGSLDFLVVGDWGRRCEYNQSEVAYQLLHENCLKRKVPTSEQGSDKNNGAHNG